jgi:hypothetical protein
VISDHDAAGLDQLHVLVGSAEGCGIDPVQDGITRSP